MVEPEGTCKPGVSSVEKDVTALCVIIPTSSPCSFITGPPLAPERIPLSMYIVWPVRVFSLTLKGYVLPIIPDFIIENLIQRSIAFEISTSCPLISGCEKLRFLFTTNGIFTSSEYPDIRTSSPALGSFLLIDRKALLLSGCVFLSNARSIVIGSFKCSMLIESPQYTNE